MKNARRLVLFLKSSFIVLQLGEIRRTIGQGRLPLRFVGSPHCFVVVSLSTDPIHGGPRISGWFVAGGLRKREIQKLDAWKDEREAVSWFGLVFEIFISRELKLLGIDF